MRVRFLLGLLVTMLALGVSSVALGGPKYPTSLSIAWSRSAAKFSGKLMSHAGCVGRRKVVVYMKRSGPDRAVGNDKSSGSGRWTVKPGRASTGDYYAKTSGVVLKSGGKCSAAKSPSTHVS